MTPSTKMRLAEVFLVPSDTVMGAAHEFAPPEPMKRDEAEEHYRLGVERYYQEYPDFDSARRHFELALHHRPNFVDAFVGLGDVNRNPFNPLRQLEAAEEAYGKALAIQASNARALLGSLELLIDRGRLEEAEMAYAGLVDQHPRFTKYSTVERYEAEARPAFGWFYPRKRNLQLLKRLGDAYYRASRYADAANRYSAILSLDSRDIEVRLAMAFAWFRAGSVEDARNVLEEVAATPLLTQTALSSYRVWLTADWIVPASDLGHEPSPWGPLNTARNQLGVIHFQCGRPDEALHWFGAADDLDEARNNRAVVLLAQGVVADAEALLLDSLRCREAAYNLALIREQQERWTDAAKCWDAFNAAEKRRHGRSSSAARRYIGSEDPSELAEIHHRMNHCLSRVKERDI